MSGGPAFPTSTISHLLFIVRGDDDLSLETRGPFSYTGVFMAKDEAEAAGERRVSAWKQTRTFHTDGSRTYNIEPLNE